MYVLCVILQEQASEADEELKKALEMSLQGTHQCVHHVSLHMKSLSVHVYRTIPDSTVISDSTRYPLAASLYTEFLSGSVTVTVNIVANESTSP